MINAFSERAREHLVRLAFVPFLALAFLAAACDHDSGSSSPPADEAAGDGAAETANGEEQSSGDGEDNREPRISFGSNDRNLLVAIGDSITAGSEISGPSYPQRLSSALGRTVVNMGVPGAYSSEAAGRARSALGRKPGWLLIMYGANDIFLEVSPDTIANNVRAAVRAARANNTVPVVATITPNLRSESQKNYAASINNRLRSMASSEGALLVDVAREFNNSASLMKSDGFHPNDTGTQVIAFAFADVLDRYF